MRSRRSRARRSPFRAALAKTSRSSAVSSTSDGIRDEVRNLLLLAIQQAYERPTLSTSAPGGT